MTEKEASDKGQEEAAVPWGRTRKIAKTAKDGIQKAGIAPWLAGFILALFAFAIGAAVFKGQKLSADPTLNLLIGALIALVGQVGQYYFGSSVGSKQKTAMLEEQIRARGNLSQAASGNQTDG